MDFEIDGENKEVVSSFKNLGSCFSEDGGPRKEVRMRVYDELKTFGGEMKIFNVKS